MKNALLRPLRPLIRLALAKGLLFPEMMAMVKGIYVHEAEAELKRTGKKVTDSNISVLSGLQRRDISKLRSVSKDTEPTVNPFARLISLWQNVPPFGENGNAHVLPRKGAAPSFDALAESVRKDVHPRTLLEALIANGSISYDPETQTVALLVDNYLPGPGSSEQLEYFSANIGDHSSAGAANIMIDPPPFFERAVHYNQLGPSELAALKRYASEIQAEALQKINKRALDLQAGENRGNQGRFRCGAFIFSEITGEKI